MKSKTATQPVNHRSAWRTLLGMAVILSIVHPLSAQAAITVTTLNDSGPGSLRQAIADAASGETIDFAVPGTITLTSGELVVTNDLTISGPGATNLTVSGNNASRVFRTANGSVTISGLTIAGGKADGSVGGGVWCGSANTLITNCTLAGNSAHTGGGALSGVLKNCTLTANRADYSGGADSSTLDQCLLTGNYAYWNGGGVSYGLLTNCTLANNTAWEGGAASDSTLINCTLIGNGFKYGGGAYSCLLTNCLISDNFAVWGGGVFASELNNCTLSRNSASFGGGVYGGSLKGCTVFSNTATASGGGGGISSAGTSHLQNTIVAKNSAPDSPDCSGIINSQDFNLIQNTNGATITNLTTHNIYGKDPLLGPLADNGGPTPTHALLPGSPAIDHGSSGGLTTDQRGQPRPFNFPAYFNADDGSDIGAYELQERPQTGPVFTVNSNDDVDDGVPGIAHCSLREAVNAANINSDSNSIVFAASLPGLMNGVTGTIVLTNGQLSIGTDLSITGPGDKNLTISGNNASRVLQITNGTVLLSGLTIANGRLQTQPSQGAGFYNSAVLTIINCSIMNNSNAVVFGKGGGGYNSPGGNLTIQRSSFFQNSSPSGFGGGIDSDGLLAIANGSIYNNFAGYYGGGVVCGSGVTLVSSTISSNSCTGSWSGYGGGGMFLNTLGWAVITNTTICSNSASGGSGGGIVVVSGYVQMRNTIVGDNSAVAAPDIASSATYPVVSSGFNLIQNTNGCFITGTTAHNIYNQDPKLGPLADLGGPTPTHALRFDSPALDAGNSGGLTTDQRGLPRPIDDPNVPNAEGGDGSDIGAYEADPNLRINGFGKTGGDIWLSFNSMLGRTYRVESTDELPPTWSVLTNGVPGTGGRFQAIDGGAASLPRRFYRTVQLP